MGDKLCGLLAEPSAIRSGVDFRDLGLWCSCMVVCLLERIHSDMLHVGVDGLRSKGGVRVVKSRTTSSRICLSFH